MEDGGVPLTIQVTVRVVPAVQFSPPAGEDMVIEGEDTPQLLGAVLPSDPV